MAETDAPIPQINGRGLYMSGMAYEPGNPATLTITGTVDAEALSKNTEDTHPEDYSIEIRVENVLDFSLGRVDNYRLGPLIGVAIDDRTGSDWDCSVVKPRAGFKHYHLRFYDEVVDVIGESIEIRFS